MTAFDESEPDEYVAERLREAIATDPAVHRLGIVVHVSNGRVLLSGSAATPGQRDAIGQLVHRLVPSYEVANEVDVPPAGRPAEVEEV
jgi:osmotically-inducible protein OsmY